MSAPVPTSFSLQLPAWITDHLDKTAWDLSTPDAQMELVLELAEQNVARATGGPFAAAVVEHSTHRLVAVGVNLVEASQRSIAHAEIMALTLAQQATGYYDLGADNSPSHVLVTSTEPCAMCLGAIPWSGVRAVVCGARHDDAHAIGFDEGSKPTDWIGALETRGIRVMRDIGRQRAVRVLQTYARGGGAIYNGRNVR